MKIAYVTTYDASELGKFSGLGYYICKALEDQGLSITKIGPLKEKYHYIMATKDRLCKYFFKKKYLRERELMIAMNYARQVERMLKDTDVDIIFSPGTIPISFINFNKPLAFWTDATFEGMVDFYPEFTNLHKTSIVNGNAIEQNALERCSLSIYSSKWAADTAIKNYQVNPSKVKVVPFGANFQSKKDINEIKSIVTKRSKEKCKLLFVGVDWHRKGGDTALEVAIELNRLGLETELTIVGCEPCINNEFSKIVKTYGYVDKSTNEGGKKIQKIYAQSHFLIMPSRAECTPVVFSEANSFGVPCISIQVGGIPTVIKNDINGRLFNPNATISNYCDYIVNIFANYSLYKKLALSSFEEYLTRLNWNVSGKIVKTYLTKLLRKS